MLISTRALPICLLLLAGCATSTEPKEQQPGCSNGYVRVLNEETGKYDCVSQMEWERMLRRLDERS